MSGETDGMSGVRGEEMKSMKCNENDQNSLKVDFNEKQKTMQNTGTL